jgi:hypothetical protein
MPGVQQATSPCQPRLSDRVAIGVLTLTDRQHWSTTCGRVERRHRLLPARLMGYYVLPWRCSPGPPTRRCCALSPLDVSP